MQDFASVIVAAVCAVTAVGGASILAQSASDLATKPGYHDPITTLPPCKAGLKPTPCQIGEPHTPLNDLPKPYRTERTWGELPPEIKEWPAVTAVEPSPDGSIYVVERCNLNSCEGRSEPPILKYDRNGKLLAAFGANMFLFPHGATVDPQGNLWVSDAGGKPGQGHQVFKFSPAGKVLMTLGQAGIAGGGTDSFNLPTDVAIAPNGDIYVADGHRDTGNNRIVIFSKDGKYLRNFGQLGSAPGDIHEPHSIAFDSQGRLFVADRVNNRIEIFTQQGKLLAVWYQFGRPSGIAITKDDTIYVADSEAGPDTGANEIGGWRKGIRIGSAKTGEVDSFIEDMEPLRDDHSGAEGVGVDADGNVYGAVVRRRMLERHVKKSQ
jgi:DNA-binding beta-propeller fold protein YncE